MEFGQLLKPLISRKGDTLKSEQPSPLLPEVRMFGSTKVLGQLSGYWVLAMVGQKVEKLTSLNVSMANQVLSSQLIQPIIMVEMVNILQNTLSS